ncbi:MAG: hypothetical protein ACJ8G3_07545 [Burkholderiaceae bacterium]
MVADDWILAASSNKLELYAQPGSFAFSKNRKSDPIAVVTGKSVDKITGQVDLEKWYVRLTDCVAKQGKLVSLTIGGEFKYDNDFVFGSGTIGSSAAKLICDVVTYTAEEKRNKSL